MKKFAFFDVDHTLYDGYLATDFNLFLAEQKYTDKDVISTEKLLKDEYRVGKIDYREAARRALQLTADCLKGHTNSTVHAWQTEFITKHDKIFPWVSSLFSQLQRRGFNIYLISAAPAPPLQAVAKSLQIENWFGTELEILDDVYTGNLRTILNYEEKHRLIQRLVHDTDGLHVGFGDSLGDVDMLSAMDKTFLYNPRSDELVALANERGWEIARENTILELAKNL